MPGGKAGSREQGLGLKPPNLARRGAGVRRRQRRARNSLLSGVLGLAQVGRGGVPSVPGRGLFPSLGAGSSWWISFRAMLVAEFTVA